MARSIAGDGSPAILQLARKIAEAEIDVIRVRRARSDRVSDELSECNYRNKTRQVFRSWLAILMNDQSESLSPEEPEGKRRKRSVEGDHKVVLKRDEVAPHRSRLAIWTHERRAISRRKFAIRAFDAARAAAFTDTPAR